jgi:hypothetical protein
MEWDFVDSYHGTGLRSGSRERSRGGNLLADASNGTAADRG